MLEPLMTKAEVAEHTRMSEKWVQRHAAELGGVSLGGRLRFRRSDVERCIEAHSLKPRRGRGGDSRLRQVS